MSPNFPMSDTASSNAAATKVVRSHTIRRPVAELYDFWRNLENLPRVIRKPATVTAVSPTVSHWEVSVPGKTDTVSWNATIINDEKNRLIAWSTDAPDGVRNAGSIRFETAPGDQGVEVTVTLRFEAPGGALTAWLAKLSPEGPEHQVADTLRRFKALMEAGEIPTTEGQPVGEPQKSKKGDHK